MPNRLAAESSPYLLQHADNPVDWYPWGEEAFNRARTLDRPILLSIGYSACHWCHVMAHESFQNAAIAEVMNRNFVNIKVDREERPDVDQVYMEAVQAMTGSGGWPLTVFLTPELKPFFGGTYFPPEDRGRLPAFARVLLMVAEAYHKRREAVDGTVAELSKALESRPRAGEKAVPDRAALKEAAEALESSWDRENGGFGGAPKFPNPLALEFLLRYHLSSGSETALSIVTSSLDKMAQGGIYDQIGGGFHRYATDSAWQIPHFEKMLYDNGLLSLAYLQAFSVTRLPAYARIAGETLDFLLREMRHENGAFFASLDADSGGGEGLFYIWTREQIAEAVGKASASKVEAYFGVNSEGNFEGANILHVANLDQDGDIAPARKALLAVREKRPRPGRDEKILASWNALVIRSLASASAWLGRPDYLAAAESCADFLLGPMNPAGGFLHSWKDGRGSIPAFLDDYALTGLAMLALNGVTAQAKWLRAAVDLTARMVDTFADRRSGLLFDTPQDAKDLFFRPRNEFDGATPAGTSSAVLLLGRMSAITGEKRYAELVDKALEAVGSSPARAPLGFSQWLCALDDYWAPSEEIVTLGKPGDQITTALLEVINSRWRPRSLIVGSQPEETGALVGMPIFQGRGLTDGRAAVYVCRNNACRAPVSDADSLKAELASPFSGP